MKTVEYNKLVMDMNSRLGEHIKEPTCTLILVVRTGGGE